MTRSEREISRRKFIGLSATATAGLVLTACAGRRGISILPQASEADLVLMNGKIITVDRRDTIVQAVAAKVPESCILVARVGPELNLKIADAISSLFKSPMPAIGGNAEKWDDISTDEEDSAMGRGSSSSLIRRIRFPLILLAILLVLAAGAWFFVLSGDSSEEVEVARAGFDSVVPGAPPADEATELPEAAGQESSPKEEEPAELESNEPIKLEEEVLPPPEPEDSPVAEESDTVIDEELLRSALKKRKIRFLDNLAVAKGKKRNFGYKKANEHCAKKETAGITGWRLPTIGELRSLRQAHMVTNGIYWSTTPADSKLACR